ncbi:hypothetical protein SAMN05421823_102515 [Catalinimonas alkaloidigena]|uniref:Carbohydrate-binding module family 96 domain-containing protein n=1 Tax=Catalinimonas alkaloidigena TaxID=1075417 RepID=A0A1G9B533_9BACT|nr:DNRLRE domain-containing protein [Catalinimonas alkaloidigena]SDK34622.1 hypothetical protein SAMN05421823_102515 [Catalinimonas alkaloidigena]
MKSLLIPALLTILLVGLLTACYREDLLPAGDQTLVLQPNSVDGKDALVNLQYPNTNYGQSERLQSLSWTIDGSNVILRSYLAFDLSGVPVGSQITSAKLSLFAYHDGTLPSEGHSHQSGSNSAYIQRVTTFWDEETITWNNQPSYSIGNQVVLPQDTSALQDYVGIDVTGLIQDIKNNPAEGHGMVISLVEESPYRGLSFASSDHDVKEKRPMLTVTYKESTSR